MFSVEGPLRGWGRSKKKKGNTKGEKTDFPEFSQGWPIYEKYEESTDNFFHGPLRIKIPEYVVSDVRLEKAQPEGWEPLST